MTERFAIYYAPSANGALWDRASVWLGRDPLSGQFYDGVLAGIARPDLLNLTQSANRYGFHATIKPPMALAADQTPDTLRAALTDFARAHKPVPLGRLQLGFMDDFLALVQVETSPNLLDLAAHVVEDFEPFRAPLSLREHAARASGNLSPRQLELLGAYGYPYVFDQFRFHMTLTDRLAPADQAEIMAAAESWFAPALAEDFVLDRLVLYHESQRGRPFVRLEDYRLEP